MKTTNNNPGNYYRPGLVARTVLWLRLLPFYAARLLSNVWVDLWLAIGRAWLWLVARLGDWVDKRRSRALSQSWPPTTQSINETEFLLYPNQYPPEETGTDPFTPTTAAPVVRRAALRVGGMTALMVSVVAGVVWWRR